MGEKELAFQWLDKAYEDPEVEMYWLKVEPPFEPLHKDRAGKSCWIKLDSRSNELILFMV